MNACIAHSADLGDIIASLPCARALGGADYVIGPILDGAMRGRESLKGPRFEALKPLLEAQPYIGKVQWSDAPSSFSHDLRDFRHKEEYGESLLNWQARHLGLQVSTAPWLQAMRSEVSLGRCVISRSLRYRNPAFPWNLIVAKNRNCLFVGLEEEYDDFRRSVGNIEYYPTKNLLELAEVIAGASLFAGNQSAPFWIAAGLGVQTIQETFPQSPNSQIERSNARYYMRGVFHL